jgi:FKBP-type peptidyl-prolyl cis-trans isomerase FkpA
MNPIAAPDRRRPFMRLLVCALFVVLAVVTGTQSSAVENEDEFYQLGVAVGRSLSEFQLSDEEFAVVQKGLHDVVKGQPTGEPTEEQMKKLGEIRNERVAKTATAYLDRVQQEEGAQIQSSGLVYFEIEPGSGEVPGATDTVKVHYHGTLPNGAVFDSSITRGEPAEFPLNRVIACWTEGVGMMKIGGKARLICPPAIAYGDRGAPPAITGGAVLTFEVELLEIKPAASAE